MNHKTKLLPKMAVNNIRKNGTTYFPFIAVSIFAVFTYFVFDLILNNDVMLTIPKANYALLLIRIGFSLLGIIMIPFLYYTNSFLIKRRKKELGLYSILGLEKKHIGIMMFWESLLIYGVVMAAALGLGLLFSKLIFLVLLNLAHLSVEATFTISSKAVADALLFYAFITVLNLFVNLFQVGKSNPVELMSDSRRGEKEPKHILLWSVAGLVCLLGGYYMAVSSKLDSMIFIAFFFAVLLVVVGTYYLFTSGSIALLRVMKRSKKLYYRPENFITVSGMLYRMKKSAAGLSNICIFGTMVIVTAVCTVAVYLGMDSLLSFVYPADFEISYFGEWMVDREPLQEQVKQLAEENKVTLEDFQIYKYCNVKVTQDNKVMKVRTDGDSYAQWYDLKLMTVEEYNYLQGTAEALTPSEVLVYSTGADFGYDTICLGEKEYQVKQELSDCKVDRKERNNIYLSYYTVILADENALAEAAAVYGVNAVDSTSMLCRFTPKGETGDIDRFYESLNGMGNFARLRDYRGAKADMESMYGGLLFIGIFFCLIFLICLLIIMYYKQVTEGFEDQKNFEIMQKVGMSDEEIRHTIKKQILLVFSLPLFGAVCHTAIAMKMVIMLMGTINLFEVKLIIACAVCVVLLFALFYSLCYRRTAGTYYRIVRKMQG